LPADLRLRLAGDFVRDRFEGALEQSVGEDGARNAGRGPNSSIVAGAGPMRFDDIPGGAGGAF